MMNQFINEIINLESFWKLNYFFRSVKPLPHGQKESINIPNYYIKHRTVNFFRMHFVLQADIHPACNATILEIKNIYQKYNIPIVEIILEILKNDNCVYNIMRYLKRRNNESQPYYPFFSKATKDITKNDILESYVLDISEFDKIFQLLLFYLINSEFLSINSISEIKNKEQLVECEKKYGLTNVTDCDFYPQGFVFENKFYLYNIFINTSIKTLNSIVPGIIEFIKDIKDNNIFMRCDSLLAMDDDKSYHYARLDEELFRGIPRIEINNLESKIRKYKTTTVRYDEKTKNKLLIVIKRNDNEKYFDIEIEELWNPYVDILIDDSHINTYFFHAQYFYEKKAFKHVDCSVNQYNKADYISKYSDFSNNDIKIEDYAEEHYKIWCVEAENIEINQWANLVYYCISEPFKELFLEEFALEF